MTYHGQVKNGVIVLNAHEPLPEGAFVEVSLLDESPTWGDVFEPVIGKAADLPPDMALNHDHYLHGLPRQ